MRNWQYMVFAGVACFGIGLWCGYLCWHETPAAKESRWVISNNSTSTVDITIKLSRLSDNWTITLTEQP